MRAPKLFVEWINNNLGFNPRAGKYSDALNLLVFNDLVTAHPPLGLTRALRPEQNADIATRSATRNVDFVLWGPKGSRQERVPYVAIENKLILAAHTKARKNRLGDIVAFANHVHNADRSAIACGLIGINISPDYENPDPFAAGMDRPKFEMEKIVTDTLEIYAKLPQRNSVYEPYDRPEAFAVFVINYNGKGKASLVLEPPAPPPGHPLHYASLIERVVRHSMQRRRLS